jgi:hypothetical protein
VVRQSIYPPLLKKPENKMVHIQANSPMSVAQQAQDSCYRSTRRDPIANVVTRYLARLALPNQTKGPSGRAITFSLPFLPTPGKVHIREAGPKYP